MHELNTLGWNAHFEAHFAPHRALGCVPGRVAVEHPQRYRVFTADGDCLAQVSGRLRHDAGERADFPAVGDWVALDRQPDGQAIIQAVLPRRSKFSRKAAGAIAREQIVAANVDVVLLVSALGADFNPRRLERYLAIAWQSGAQPIVVLNKADLCADVPDAIAEASAVAPGAPVMAVSCAKDHGLAPLLPELLPGRTLALLGSSGVGKSSLLNRLAGTARHAVQAVRADDEKGRHTTTFRELVVLPSGALLIDTPGMRELGLWQAATGLGDVFEDIEALAVGCRFRDCAHAAEPGCAIQTAIDVGQLTPERLASYRKLERELAHVDRQRDAAAMRQEKQRWKQISQAARANSRHKRSP